VAKSNRPPASSQSLCDSLRQFGEDTDRWRKLQEDFEQFCKHARFPDSEKLRRWAEALRVKPSPPKPSRSTRKRGGGRQQKLTPEERARARDAYWADPPRRGVRKQDEALAAARKTLPKDKRPKSVTSDRTLRRYVGRRPSQT
jgi:hypothetical protein